MLTFDHLGAEARDAFVVLHKIGKMIKYPSYTATAKEEYPVDENLKMRVKLIINGVHGKDISRYLYGKNDPENEILFDRDSAFIPTKIYNEGNTSVIELEECVNDGQGDVETANSTVRRSSSTMQQVQKVAGVKQASDSDMSSISGRDTDGAHTRTSKSLPGELSRGQRDVGDTGRRIEKQAAVTNPQDALATTIADKLIKKGTAFNSSLLFELADKA